MIFKAKKSTTHSVMINAGSGSKISLCANGLLEGTS